jgi:flagellar biosynthetic protein FliR
MGFGARLFMAAMAVAGELISFMAGFQSATLFDPSSASSTGAPAVLLTLAAGLLVLVTGLHHELIRGVAASYVAFPPGVLPDVGDVNAAVVSIVARVFTLGVMLAAPLIVTGLLANAMFGVLNRLIPQLQVFFVSMPMVIAVSLVVLAASLGMMLQLWGQAVQGNISVFQAEDVM